MSVTNETFKLFLDKMGGRQATNYIGLYGEIFYDPGYRELRISDGISVGGLPLFQPIYGLLSFDGGSTSTVFSINDLFFDGGNASTVFGSGETFFNGGNV
jgi:hypothetical protein